MILAHSVFPELLHLLILLFECPYEIDRSGVTRLFPKEGAQDQLDLLVNMQIIECGCIWPVVEQFEESWRNLLSVTCNECNLWNSPFPFPCAFNLCRCFQ